MRKIQYNTFGRSKTDNKLVDFINSLREAEHNPRLAEKIQSQVMHFIHCINKELWQFPCRPTWCGYEREGTAKNKNEYLHRLYQLEQFKSRPMFFDSKMNQKIVDLYIADLKRRLHAHSDWRHPLRCYVWAVVLEKLRTWGLR
jgi:hypothetical protein